MFFNCDLEYAYNNGGEITRSFILNLPTWLYNEPAVIDTRVHMLMPGWFPAIPGYHHDDVPRPEIPVGQHFITAGQPDYDNMRYKSKHFLGLVNAHIAPTEFIIGRCEMPKVEQGELVYRKWHYHLEKLLEQKAIGKIEAPDRQIISFDWQTFHQCVKARHNGWRWFGRVSIDTDRVKSITNEIRKQVQVYMEFPMEGW